MPVGSGGIRLDMFLGDTRRRISCRLEPFSRKLLHRRITGVIRGHRGNTRRGTLRIPTISQILPPSKTLFRFRSIYSLTKNEGNLILFLLRERRTVMISREVIWNLKKNFVCWRKRWIVAFRFCVSARHGRLSESWRNRRGEESQRANGPEGVGLLWEAPCALSW